MTAADILKDLKPLGTDSYKNILLNHGIKEPVFGVKIEELKKIQKRVKKDFQLSLDLYDTGVYDAQYLAGLIADETKMTSKILRQWLAKANSPAICGWTVAWIAAESPHGWELAMEWIELKKEMTAQTGWATLSSLVSIKADADLDLKELKRLLGIIEKTIHTQPNLVREKMNGFVISLGCYVKDLTDLAMKTGEKTAPSRSTRAIPPARFLARRTILPRFKNAEPSERSARRRDAELAASSADTPILQSNLAGFARTSAEFI